MPKSGVASGRFPCLSFGQNATINYAFINIIGLVIPYTPESFSWHFLIATVSSTVAVYITMLSWCNWGVSVGKKT